MKQVKFIIVSLVVLFSYIQSVQAEVPMHNKDLDSKCPKGFQWSRDTASCKQADCPAGAGRTYGLDCNCGEAWYKPFRTCYDSKTPGLAVSCVASGAKCPDEKPIEVVAPVSLNTSVPTCSSFKRILNLVPIESFKRAVGADACNATPAVVMEPSADNILPEELIADAEKEITDAWYKNYSMDKRIVEVTLSDGKQMKIGVFPTGYTKPDPDQPGKYIPTVMYTSDGYNFYDEFEKVLKPSWWQRVWASSKPTLDSQTSQVAKDLYNNKYSFGNKERSRADTWIERGSFDKLLREYIKRRDEGKTPNIILAENSEFLDLVSTKVQNPYADLIKDKYLFEAGYQSIVGFRQFEK